MYSFKNYKFVELSTDSWGHAQDGSICTRAPDGATRRRSPTTASAWTAPQDAAAFGMKQA